MNDYSKEDLYKESILVIKQLKDKKKLLLLEKNDFFGKDAIWNTLRQEFQPVHIFYFDKTEAVFWKR